MLSNKEKLEFIRSGVFNEVLKDLGFARKGAICNKRLENGIIQIVWFWALRKYDETEFKTEFAVRVPEISNMNFIKDNIGDKFYDVGDTWIRNHHKFNNKFCIVDNDINCAEIVSDTCKFINTEILDWFAKLDTREKIWENANLNKLDKVFLYGADGKIEQAQNMFDEYCADTNQRWKEVKAMIKHSAKPLNETAAKLGLQPFDWGIKI